jgi:ribonucleoside-diphosphate reductase alpha chain
MPLLLQVRKSNQSLEDYQTKKIQQTLQKILKNKIDLLDQDLLITEIEKQLFPNIATSQITEILILTATSFIEKDLIYDELAAGLLLQKLFRAVFKPKINSRNLALVYRQTFVDNLREIGKKEILDARWLDFDLEKLSQVLVLERDNLFNYLGLETLYSRYFLREEKQILETPQAF